MPYINAKDDRREKLRNGEPAFTAGELNYQIFYHVKHGGIKYWYFIPYSNVDVTLIEKFVIQFLGDKPNYQRYNDMTGALVRCEKEIRRRLNLNTDFLLGLMNSYDDEIAKYEDKKILENDDVE